VRNLKRILLAAVGVTALASVAAAQPPGGPHRDGAKDYSQSPIVTRMMAFDKNKDGKLTRDEITDPRLLRLFDLADTNKDGVVTKEELMAVAARLEAEGPQDRGFGGPPGGPGGPGGRGPGGFGGPPQPGQVLPPFLQERLNLTDDQKKELSALQKEVDDRLGKILTDEQKKQLKDMREGFGRGGPGGRGGRGPGGPPRGPDGDRPPE